MGCPVEKSVPYVAADPIPRTTSTAVATTTSSGGARVRTSPAVNLLHLAPLPPLQFPLLALKLKLSHQIQLFPRQFLRRLLPLLRSSPATLLGLFFILHFSHSSLACRNKIAILGRHRGRRPRRARQGATPVAEAAGTLSGSGRTAQRRCCDLDAGSAAIHCDLHYYCLLLLQWHVVCTFSGILFLFHVVHFELLREENVLFTYRFDLFCRTH